MEKHNLVKKMDFGFLKKIFKFGKKNDGPFSDSKQLEPLPSVTPSSTPSSFTSPIGAGSAENVASENMKAKIDLVMTQMDSLKIQYESINQRLIQIERMVREIYESSRTPPSPRF